MARSAIVKPTLAHRTVKSASNYWLILWFDEFRSEKKRKYGNGNIKCQNDTLFFYEMDKDLKVDAAVRILIHNKFEHSIEEIEYIS